MLPWPYRVFFWGTHGLAIEVVFTALWEYMVSGDVLLKGFSSIWSILSYGLGITLFGEKIHEVFLSRNLPFLLRCIAYVPCFFACEFAFGVLFSLLHVCPWDYSEFEYDLMGLITLEYTPFWFMAGIYLELLIGVLGTLQVVPQWKLAEMRVNK